MKESIEKKYLEDLMERKIQIRIFLVNGYQIKGLIKNFDDKAIYVESENKSQLIYKHSISTVVPIVKLKKEIER